MQRKSFLLGLCAGVVVGVAVMSVTYRIERPASHFTPGSVTQNPVVHVVPAIENDEPSYWQKREFNGRPYYIVPLQKSDS